jgi:putative tricarboxylic transport membrane protein
MELKFREALDLSGGDISGLFNEPLAVFVYVIIGIVLVAPIIVRVVRDRRGSGRGPRLPYREEAQPL